MRLRSIALSLGGLAAGLLIAEGAARVMHTPLPAQRVYDPLAYRIPTPGLHESFLNRQGEHVEFELNELGMRGPSISAPVADGTLTVVFLGGSTTENYAYRDEDTFPVIAAKIVSERMARPVRVFNAGMSGAIAGTNLGRLQHQILDLHPDLVVVMEGINDLLGGFNPKYRADGRHLARPALATDRPRSYLYNLYRERTFSPHRSPPPKPGAGMSAADFDRFPARRVFERNVRSMAAIASSQDLDALFLTMATMYSADPKPEDVSRFALMGGVAEAGDIHLDVQSLAAGMKIFNAAITALPATGTTRTFDLAAVLPQSWDVFYDDCHFTKAGNRLVAETIAPRLEEILRQRKAKPRD
jgi:lysophospholipase L1-like esterase